MAAAYIAVQGKIGQLRFIQQGFAANFADFKHKKRKAKVNLALAVGL